MYIFIQFLLYGDSSFKSILTTCSIPLPNARAFLARLTQIEVVTMSLERCGRASHLLGVLFFLRGAGGVICFGWFSWKHFLLIIMYVYINIYDGFLWLDFVLGGEGIFHSIRFYPDQSWDLMTWSNFTRFLAQPAGCVWTKLLLKRSFGTASVAA